MTSHSSANLQADLSILSPAVAHRVIRASAGTGKTYQLSNRYLALLRRGVEPDTILATTFTRKAAGEILERVLTRLVAAAGDDRAANELGRRLDDGGWADALGEPLSRSRCLEMLGRMIDKLHRVSISTLDSFFNHVVGCFRWELDVPAGARIVDDAHPLTRRLRRGAIDAMLGDDDVETLVDLLRRLHRDDAQRGVTDAIDAVVTQLYDVYRQSPDERVWTTLPTPEGRLDRVELAQAINALREMEPQLPKTKKGVPYENWTKDWSKKRGQADRRDWPAFLSDGVPAALVEGKTSYSRVEIPRDWSAVYQPLIDHARAALLDRVARQTHATWDLLNRFDRHYTRMRRQHAVLLYSDLLTKLAHDLPLLGDGFLLDVYYRLDGRVGHLLLDEFQDTSLEQWAVLEPIAQEIASHSDGSRSFFCVGDPKQAIYGWRGGCAELTDELGQRLNLPNESFESLSVSYRSAAVVLETVNAVMGNLGDNPALSRVADHARAWQQRYEAHRTHDDALPGYVELSTSTAAAGRDAVEIDKSGEESDAAESAVTAHDNFSANRIAQIVSSNPGRSVGVLVNSNGKVRTLLQLLRRHGVPASGEGGQPITDDPAVCVILSALMMADHPGDRAAAFHVIHSPLVKIIGLASTAPGSIDTAAGLIRRSLLVDGYAATIGAWVKALASCCDRAGLIRLTQLIELAQRYDTQVTLRPGDFVRYVEATAVEEPSPAPVRVMTINKAKGLEFDIVVLVDLSRTLLSDRDLQSDLVFLRRPSPTGPVRAVHRYANAAVRGLCPELEQAYQEQRARRFDDDLCKLYVAMTRARHALHMITEPLRPKKKSTRDASGVASHGWSTPSYAAILRRALSTLGQSEGFDGGRVLYANGDPEWVAQIPMETDRQPVHDDARTPLPIRFAPPKPGHRRLWRPLQPSSAEAAGWVRAGDLLSIDTSLTRLRGRLIHAWLERTDWLDTSGNPAPEEKMLRAVAKNLNVPIGNDGWLDQQIQQFMDMLDRPAAREALAEPVLSNNTDQVELWKERRFAVHVDDRLISGVFDRVHVYWRQGTPVRADLIDFKTDTVTIEELPRRIDHYRPQLDAYRAALCTMLGLTKEAVRARLLFTGPGVCRDV